jgi:hypothetical protein
MGDKVSLFSQFYSTVLTGITDIIEKSPALSGEKIHSDSPQHPVPKQFR